jgi:hypothetical protein
MPLASRLGMMISASFTLTMLLGATVVWAVRQTGGTVSLNVILWILFPITFFSSSIALEYLEDGSLARSVRASFFNTGFAVVVIGVLYGIARGIS